MALRNQPYFPLYVQDYLTDEKLNSCSPASQGVYIKILCVLHKQESYGKLLFKQKDKQKNSTLENFALKFAKLLPFDEETILSALTELVDEGVLTIEGEILYQKRMVKDGAISDARSKNAKKGGGNPILYKQKDKQEFKQIDKQNPEYEYENNNNSNSIENSNFQKFREFSFEEIKKILIEESQIWYEQIRMADSRITSDQQLKDIITKWLLKQNSTGSYFPVSIDNVRRHFANSLPKMEIESKNDTEGVITSEGGITRLTYVF